MDKEASLQAALAQIDRAFGKAPDTPEARRARAQRRNAQLVPLLDPARKAVEADKARHRGECPVIPIDPFAAYAVAWSLRKEADTDESIKHDAVVDALENSADFIENGEAFGAPEDLLADLVAEIHFNAYIIEHGVEPPAMPPPPPYCADETGDNLPF